MNKKHLPNLTNISSQGKYVDRFNVLNDIYHFNILKMYHFNIIYWVVSRRGVIIKILTTNNKACALLTTNTVQTLTNQPYSWYKVPDTPCCAKSYLVGWSWSHGRICRWESFNEYWEIKKVTDCQEAWSDLYC